MINQNSYARWSLEPYCIGMKLRGLRTRKRLTLSRLATETGLSTALLSKLETDRMIPTLPTLTTICRVYGVGLSYFFSEPQRHSLSITRRAHLEGKGRSSEAVKHTPLHAMVENGGLRAESIELAPDGTSYMPVSNGGLCGFLYVVAGKLRMDSSGMVEVLDAGDCAYIDSQAAMAWSAGNKETCRALLVLPA